MAKLISFGFLSLILIVFGTRTYKFYKKDNSVSVVDENMTYQASKNTISKRSFKVDIFGKVKSDATIAILADSTGKVQDVLVEDFARVSKGQKIVKIDDYLKSANRVKQGSSKYGVSSDVDASYGVAKSDKSLKRSSVRYAISPCDGYMTEILTEKGASVNLGPGGGTHVASVVCDEKIKIKGNVSTDNAIKIKKGMAADIVQKDRIVKGFVSGIGRVVNKYGSIDVEIEINKIDQGKIYINDNVEISIFTDPVLISMVELKNVVVDRNGKIYVYLVKNGIVSKKEISVLNSDDEFFYTKDLAAEDIIVSSAINTLYDGKKIEYEVVE